MWLFFQGTIIGLIHISCKGKLSFLMVIVIMF